MICAPVGFGRGVDGRLERGMLHDRVPGEYGILPPIWWYA